MALLSEYAFTPDVIDGTSYGSVETCGLHLQNIKEVLIQEGLVRNLWNGEWAQTFVNDHRPWHPRGKELIKKLALQKRLIFHTGIGQNLPSNDSEWCEEALASHKTIPLNGIIVTDCISGLFKGQPIIAPVQKLSTTSWWSSRSPSIRPHRRIEDYKNALNLVLKHANSIMFIDPHLDPGRGHYQEFIKLLEEAGGRTPVPLIEIHRVCYRGSGSQRQILNLSDLEETFRKKLSETLKQIGLDIEVFIWDDFHDRHLISNLVGIGMQNGFDTTTAPNSQTTWTRLGRKDRDDIQKEFDPASNRHSLKGRFRVP
ncbi:MAG: hypothetical protein HY879_20460 [Deltaproteobacteria bacterium]|nr:hypothetical protein [Deltaproteobacteria bacterium]